MGCLRSPVCTYDFEASELRSDAGDLVVLRPQCLAVLHCLATAAGRLVAEEELMATVWREVVVTDDSLVQCITSGARSATPTIGSCRPSRSEAIGCRSCEGRPLLRNPRPAGAWPPHRCASPRRATACASPTRCAAKGRRWCAPDAGCSTWNWSGTA